MKDPLAAAVDYWLKGNVENVSISWKSVAEALDSSFVGESGLAKRIRLAHCTQRKVDEGKAEYISIILILEAPT